MVEPSADPQCSYAMKQRPRPPDFALATPSAHAPASLPHGLNFPTSLRRIDRRRGGHRLAAVRRGGHPLLMAAWLGGRRGDCTASAWARAGSGTSGAAGSAGIPWQAPAALGDGSSAGRLAAQRNAAHGGHAAPRRAGLLPPPWPAHVKRAGSGLNAVLLPR